MRTSTPDCAEIDFLEWTVIDILDFSIEGVGRCHVSHTNDSDCPTCCLQFENDLRVGINDLISNNKFRRPQYLLNQMDQLGVVVATRRLVSNVELSDGFADLALLGLLDRSLESSVLGFSGPCPIFDEGVKSSARRKLGK